MLQSPDNAVDRTGTWTRGRETGKIARINARKKFCANDVIPAYERYYKRILSES